MGLPHHGPRTDAGDPRESRPTREGCRASRLIARDRREVSRSRFFRFRHGDRAGSPHCCDRACPRPPEDRMSHPRHRATPHAHPLLSRRSLLGAGGLALAALGAAPLAEPAAAAPVTTAPFLPYGTSSWFRTPVAGLATDQARTTAFR